MIAQQAARLMAEDGIHDYAYAKKKAGRQLGAHENSVLPTNAEIEEEIRLYHQQIGRASCRERVCYPV